MLNEADKSRFWSKVDKTPGQGPNGDCWTWTGAKNDQGYGQIRIGGRIVYAHRLALTLLGHRIDPRLEVLHSCDLPCCVRPEHLSQGTHAENMRQISIRGRCKPKTGADSPLAGDKAPAAKLTWADARRVRELWNTGEYSQRELGDLFGVSSKAIGYVVRGETFKEAI